MWCRCILVLPPIRAMFSQFMYVGKFYYYYFKLFNLFTFLGPQFSLAGRPRPSLIWSVWLVELVACHNATRKTLDRFLKFTQSKWKQPAVRQVTWLCSHQWSVLFIETLVGRGFCHIELWCHQYSLWFSTVIKHADIITVSVTSLESDERFQFSFDWRDFILKVSSLTEGILFWKFSFNYIFSFQWRKTFSLCSTNWKQVTCHTDKLPGTAADEVTPTSRRTLIVNMTSLNTLPSQFKTLRVSYM